MIRFLLPLLFSFSLVAQPDTLSPPPFNPETDNPYRVRTLWEGVGSLGLMIGATTGIDAVRRKPPISDAILDRLATEGTSRLDRWGLDQDALKRVESGVVSDYFFNGSVLLPFTLFVDRKFRKDFLDITVLYLQAHALSASTYAFSPIGPGFVDRYRPVAYYDEIPRDERRQGNNKNSFFSGHVSTTSVGCYYFAKVLSDYNPQWTGGRRALVFGLASLPPAFVAVQRVRALKHFPTDSAAGIAVGAFWGIMVPHIHKVWQRNHRSRLTMGGYYEGGAVGAGFVLTY